MTRLSDPETKETWKQHHGVPKFKTDDKLERIDYLLRTCQEQWMNSG